VVETAGKAQVHVTGLGTPNQNAPLIENGTVTAFQLWSPYNEAGWPRISRLASWAARSKLKSGGSFRVPKLGTIKIGENARS